MKTFNIISADIITKRDVTPFVGLTININGKQEQIARTCKQALLDLHKSARASNIPAGLFDNGIDVVTPMLYNQFREAIIGLVNKTGIADVEFYEAGSEYEATDVSSAVKAGLAQVGDVLKTEKKGSRVEGFMTFPLTDVEVSRREALAMINPELLLNALLGITNVAPKAEPKPADVPDVTPTDTTIQGEAFGALPASDFDEPETEEPAKAPAKASAKVDK